MPDYPTSSEIISLQKQNADGAIYRSEQREKLFGTNRRSEILAQLSINGEIHGHDVWENYLTETTKNTSSSQYLTEQKIQHHLSENYLMNEILKLSGLIAYYPMNEIEGTVCRNYAPATVGTLNGAITGATLAQTGKAGRSYSFDGTNDDVSITDNNSLDLTTTITIGAIIYPTGWGTSSVGRILDKSALTTGYGFSLNNNTITKGLRFGGSNLFVSSNSNVIDLNGYYYVVVTFDSTLPSSNVTFYVNGISAGGGNLTTACSANAESLVIGNIAISLDRCFPGKLQHVYLMNTVQAASSILRMSNIIN